MVRNIWSYKPKDSRRTRVLESGDCEPKFVVERLDVGVGVDVGGDPSVPSYILVSSSEWARRSILSNSPRPGPTHRLHVRSQVGLRTTLALLCNRGEGESSQVRLNTPTS